MCVEFTSAIEAIIDRVSIMFVAWGGLSGFSTSDDLVELTGLTVTGLTITGLTVTGLTVTGLTVT